MTSLSNRRALAGLAALAGVLVALAGPGRAGAEHVTPQVTLGPTTILNGLAVVSGSVSEPSAAANLTVNGQPLQVTTAGTFAGVVDLGGQSVLSVSVANPGTGDASTVTIPLNTNTVGPGGVLSSEALTALEQAAVSIVKPVEGFVSVGDKPIEVSGGVGNGDKLVGLSVNGVDALSLLTPNGGFLVPVPGTSKEINVLLTDAQGVSLESSYRTTSQSATTVSATDADGVRIAKIRYFAKGVKRTKRLRMIVTVRDRRNLLIHGAVVTVRSARTDRIVGRAKVKTTNPNGKATFVLRLRRAAFGKRLLLVTTAKTPHAKVTKRSSVRMPRLSSAKRR